MYRIPARLTIRRSVRLFFILASFGILFLDLSPSALPQILHLSRPKSDRERLEVHYQRFPTFEYDSLFRIHVDQTLEASLDSILRGVETSILQASDGGDRANKTIWHPHTEKDLKTYAPWMEQWKRVNPDWGHLPILLPSTDVSTLLVNTPELLDIYNSFGGDKWDLLRWLVLWYFGGLWVEPDTWDRIGLGACEPLIPLLSPDDSFNKNRNKATSLVVGVEVDEPFLDGVGQREFGLSRAFGFGKAIVWAPRRFDPFLRMAVVRSIAHHNVYSKGLVSPGNSHNNGLAEEIAGKHMFTDVILDILSESLGQDHPLRDRGAGLDRRVSWKWFEGLREAMWIFAGARGDMEGRGLLVLPVNIWASGQGHSRAGDREDPAACVNHEPGLRPSR